MRGIERDHKISDILDQIARESAKTETDMEAEQQELNATAAASPAANGEQQNVEGWWRVRHRMIALLRVRAARQVR